MPPTIVTGYTAAKMDEILSNVIKAATVNGSGHLIVTYYDDTTADLGLVKGSTGATGATGPPGTAGTWHFDDTPSIQGMDTTYNTIGTIVIPTAGFARKVTLWSQVTFASTVAGIYRAAIRDNTSGTPDTVVHLPWRCPVDGYPGGISLVSTPIDIPASQGKTFIHTARRDISAGGAIDSDANATKFTALVTAA